MIKTILAATDGSDHARKAVRLAVDLADKYGAKLVLVTVLLRGELDESLRHMAEVERLKAEGGKPLQQAIAAIPEARFPVDMIPPEPGDSHDDILKAVAEQILDSAEHEARERGAKDIERIAEDGDVVNRVLQVAADAGADLIVTGSRGLSDLKGMLVGSTSHKLSHHADCTVVTVR
jgi:nucleotide-binding universal stress UspA family protein